QWIAASPTPFNSLPGQCEPTDLRLRKRAIKEDDFIQSAFPVRLIVTAPAKVELFRIALRSFLNARLNLEVPIEINTRPAPLSDQRNVLPFPPRNHPAPCHGRSRVVPLKKQEPARIPGAPA